MSRTGTCPPIRILIVDDYGLVREGLTALIERRDRMTVVGSVSNGKEAILAATRLAPDLILMDW